MCADFSGSSSTVPVESDWVSSEVELEASDNLLLLAKGNHTLSNPCGPESNSARGDNCNAEEVIKGEHEDNARASPELVRLSKKKKMESFPPDQKVKRESYRAYTTTVTVREGKGKGKENMEGCDDDRSNEANSNSKDGGYKLTLDQLQVNTPVEKGNIEKKKRNRSSGNLKAGAEGIHRRISHSRNIYKTSERFKCNICDKSFSTHQGLGGHMSSHSKVTIKKSRSGDDHEGCALADQEADEFRLSAATATQELENDGDTECCGDSSDGPPSVRTLGRKMLAIDLNKLPPTEEDEQEG